MKFDPVIIWEKWQDPFFDFDGVMPTELEEEDLQPYYEENYEENAEQKPQQQKFPMIVTPMGLLPYSESNACSKLFNFWVGHTNFTINQNIKKMLEETSGIESLDIFTRYRFRIGVGKAFKDSVVMREINNTLYEYMHNE